MKNKKAQTLTVGFVMAMFVGIIILIFLFGGGVTTIYKITRLMKDIPPIVWVVFGMFLLIKMFGGSRRR
jgi:intracellular septation protein A